jgi:hypothetical protein
MNAEKADQLTIAAYAAYGASVGWKNFAGNAMPEWHELPPRIQEAWRASVRAFVSSLTTEAMAAAGNAR